MGHDVYQEFVNSWEEPPGVKAYNIVIGEQNDLRLGNWVVLEIGDSVYRTLLKPREGDIAQAASEAIAATRQYLGDHPAMAYAASTYEALRGADALIICTEWTKFREPDFERMQSLMKTPVIFDGRNLYNPAKLAGLGFTYFHVGQKVEY